MAKLQDEINNLNQRKKIKIRLNPLPDGFSLYLEYNKDYKRERQFLGLKVSNSKRPTKADERTLYEAEISRDMKELELFGEKGNFVLQTKITEADFFEYFKALYEKNKLPSYNGSLQQLKTFTKKYHRTSYLKFSSIDSKFCLKFKEFLLDLVDDSELSNHTAKTYLTVFSASLNKAVQEKIIPVNPCTKIRIKPIATKRDFLTEEELKDFIMVDTPFTEIKRAFIFSTQTSLRLGDIRDLTFRDIKNGFIYFRQRKNKGVSHLKLSKLALQIVEEQKKDHPGEKYVFPLPSSRTYINDRLREMALKAEIDKHVHYHVSRHTFATIALSKGVDIYTVSQWMGHSSVAITEIYANLVNKKRDEVADIINVEITEQDMTEHKNKVKQKGAKEE